MTDTRSIGMIAPLGSYRHPLDGYGLAISFSVCVCVCV